MQLTEAEATVRTLKSELYIRPLFHQPEARVKAHVLVASTVHSADIVLPSTDGCEIRLRRMAELMQMSIN